jgi:isopenicillin-N N-acyltransferase-like protein
MNSKGTKKLKVIEVSGSHYEMGFQYGTACPGIRKILDGVCQMFGGTDEARAIIQKYVPMYLPAVEKYAPEIVEEMKGIASGANVELEDILLINIMYEISMPSIMGGCTAFAAAGEATADGEVIAGQNFDAVDHGEESIIILKMNPAQGPRILSMAPIGSLGLIGFNSAGLSFNLNLLKNKDALTPTGGVPTHIILRKLFMCENIGQAITMIGSAEGRAAKNYLLTDEKGDIIDVETTKDDLDIQYPERGMLTHANHFKADRFKNDDLAYLFVPDAYVRSYRLFHLMERHHGKLTVDILKQLLQDHNNYPNAICRHSDLKSPLEMARLTKTLVSIITCPKERKAYMSVGNPCENEYSEYLL